MSLMLSVPICLPQKSVPDLGPESMGGLQTSQLACNPLVGPGNGAMDTIPAGSSLVVEMELLEIVQDEETDHHTQMMRMIFDEIDSSGNGKLSKVHIHALNLAFSH